jgi:hypothetical protein
LMGGGALVQGGAWDRSHASEQPLVRSWDIPCWSRVTRSSARERQDDQGAAHRRICEDDDLRAGRRSRRDQEVEAT